MKNIGDCDIVALADPNAVMELDECRHDGWCRIVSETGLKGWARQIPPPGSEFSEPKVAPTVVLYPGKASPPVVYGAIGQRR